MGKGKMRWEGKNKEKGKRKERQAEYLTQAARQSSFDKAKRVILCDTTYMYDLCYQQLHCTMYMVQTGTEQNTCTSSACPSSRSKVTTHTQHTQLEKASQGSLSDAGPPCPPPGASIAACETEPPSAIMHGQASSCCDCVG